MDTHPFKSLGVARNNAAVAVLTSFPGNLCPSLWLMLSGVIQKPTPK